MIARTRLLLSVMLTIFIVFAGRLVYLQLVMAQEYELLSTQNFVVEQRISPLRGRILAGDGTVLADNRVAYDLMYRGGDVKNWERITYLLELDEAPPRQPDPGSRMEMENGVTIEWNIPDRFVPSVSELLAGQANLYLRERIERTYPTNLAAQVVGYTALADPVRFPGYATDELVGVMGIEAGMERSLFGAAGARIAEVDNMRSVLRESELVPAQPGRDIHLTLDPQVQRWAEDVLAAALPLVNAERRQSGLPAVDTVRGALLAVDPRTGAILAMASSPTFDQNIFTRRPSNPDAVSAVLNDSTNLPLQNRTVEAYPPASLFKLVTSSTLLDKGYMTPNQRYECAGRINYGGRNWLNWTSSYRGVYTNVQAIADSCNTFYWLAAMDTPSFSVGWAPFIEDLNDRAHDFGFGTTVGVGLPEEKAGRIPDEAFKRATTGEPWYPGFTLNSSIGQGDILATPLQALQLVHILANDGVYRELNLVSRIGNQTLPVAEKRVQGSHWGLLREGMERMISDHGAARHLGRQAGFQVTIAGKTGTAQVGRQGQEHAWFMGYGPSRDAEIAMVVFIENGISSANVAVPLAAQFLHLYFNDADGTDPS